MPDILLKGYLQMCNSRLRVCHGYVEPASAARRPHQPPFPSTLTINCIVLWCDLICSNQA